MNASKCPAVREVLARLAAVLDKTPVKTASSERRQKGHQLLQLRIERNRWSGLLALNELLIQRRRWVCGWVCEEAMAGAAQDAPKRRGGVKDPRRGPGPMLEAAPQSGRAWAESRGGNLGAGGRGGVLLSGSAVPGSPAEITAKG